MLNAVFAALALNGAQAVASPPKPPVAKVAISTEEQAVRTALNHYLMGHATGKKEEFAKAFYPEARLLFVRDGKLTTIESADYVARASGAPPADEAKRKRWIEWVDISGDAAVAKIILDYPATHFVDYMTLLKVDGSWRIAHKSFHADRKPTKP